MEHHQSQDVASDLGKKAGRFLLASQLEKMEKDNEYANIYQQMSNAGQGGASQCCGACGSCSTLPVTPAATAAPGGPGGCHCLQIHHHPAGGATHILHIHPHPHLHHHPHAHHVHHHHPAGTHGHHHRIQGLSSDSDYRSVYSSSSSLYSMPVFHQPPPPPPPPPPLPPQNPSQQPQTHHHHHPQQQQQAMQQQPQGQHQVVHATNGGQLVVDPSRLQMRSPVSSSAATYSDSSQYGTHSPIALIRDKVSDARKLVEYLPYHTAARCGGGRRGECDSSNNSNGNNNINNNLNNNASNKQQCFKYSIQGSLTHQQRRYLTASSQHNHQADPISTISGAVIHNGGAQLGPGSAKTTSSSASTCGAGVTSASSTAGICPSPSKLKSDNPLTRFLRSAGLFKSAENGDSGHSGQGGDGSTSTGSDSRRRARLIVLPLIFFLLLAACGLVVYFTVGQRANSRAQELISPEDVISVIFAEFRITNQEFLRAYNDSDSPEFKEFAGHIQNQLDSTFGDDESLQNEYLGSQVVALLPGSVVVQAHVFLNTPFDPKGPDTLGLIFVRSLRNLHGQMWLGQFAVDIHSIMFTEVNKALIVGAQPDLRGEADRQEGRPSTMSPLATDPADEDDSDEEATLVIVPPNWGAWGPWSACPPATDSCSSPAATQDRTRTCNLDGGRGDVVDSISECLARGGGDIEVRRCPCVMVPKKKPTAFVNSTVATQSTSTVTPPKASTVKMTTTTLTELVEAVEEEQVKSQCDGCKPDEVCVALAGEAYPTCRAVVDAEDPTGCGGLCKIDREVCQRLDGEKGAARRCLDASLCLVDEWKCRNGLCIPEEKRCDGHFNCYDHTDEMDCECDAATQFQCGNKTSCLPIESRCNGFVDCWDGSDEQNCTQPEDKLDCGPSEHSCGNGQCIPKTYFCDGFKDCSDGTDEPIGCGGDCMAQEWRCLNGRCIKNLTVCDGYNTCGDNSDEMNCEPRHGDGSGGIGDRPTLRHSGCGSGSFKCSRTGACVPSSAVCNGVRDCDDGSDETLCKNAVKGIDVPQATRLLS